MKKMMMMTPAPRNVLDIYLCKHLPHSILQLIYTTTCIYWSVEMPPYVLIQNQNHIHFMPGKKLNAAVTFYQDAIFFMEMQLLFFSSQAIFQVTSTNSTSRPG
jgi:hypothetical protein